MGRSFLRWTTAGYRYAGGFLDRRACEIGIMHVSLEILNAGVFDSRGRMRQSTRLFFGPAPAPAFL